MRDTTITWPRARLAYVVVIMSWLSYIALSIGGTRTGSTYHFNDLQIVALQLSIFIPVLIIWLVALHGVETFKQYADRIKGSAEAGAIQQIATGLAWSLVYLILLALVGAAVSCFADTAWESGALALRTFGPLVPLFIAFTLLFKGTRRLRQSASKRLWTLPTIAMVVLYVIFATTFTWLFLSTAGSTDTRGLPLYALPTAWLIPTVVVPYLITWFLGLLAAINLSLYRHHVSGLIYRQALADLSRGIASVIIFAITLQMFTMIGRGWAGLPVGVVLIILYLLVVLYGLGFWFIRSGSKKLTQIEIVQ